MGSYNVNAGAIATTQLSNFLHNLANGAQQHEN